MDHLIDSVFAPSALFAVPFVVESGENWEIRIISGFLPSDPCYVQDRSPTGEANYNPRTVYSIAALADNTH